MVAQVATSLLLVLMTSFLVLGVKGRRSSEGHPVLPILTVPATRTSTQYDGGKVARFWHFLFTYFRAKEGT